MRLLVSCIPYDGGRSGISVYIRETVRSLISQGHELTLLVEPGADAAAIAGGPVKSVQAPRWTRRPALSMLWHLLALPRRMRRRRGDFDGFFLCAANRRVCRSYPLPTVATVHDLANFHIPGKYSPLRMLYLARILPFFAKRAQRLVAVSGATKADMVRFWHCREEDVTVLYNGLDPTCREAAGKAPARGSALLYISRIEHPGKNHVRLIEAYSRLPRALAQAHPLVLAGADWKDAGKVHAAAAGSPYSDLIRFTGFVPDAELGALWRDAGFYVFPSLFEGFGLSLIEAMARGVPCACSNNGSLGEIAGDVAITFDPEDTGDIAAALGRLFAEGGEERAARVARGLEWIRRYSWEGHARGVAGLIASGGAGK
ncbi:MAG: glycosyltransferase family 4 protein [Kiritimatiellae bacterium]|nr:glycosyltransferase family 4 protein [Kiritimatiellia bacterium]